MFTPGKILAACWCWFLLAAPVIAGEPSFHRDVMAVLSKAGCNAGACHGNAHGKASFKLSLRGENPDLDYLALTHDQLTRRLNLMDPAQSLILKKATAELAHEGGQRFKPDSLEASILLRWIQAGAKRDDQDLPALARLEVTPLREIIVEPRDAFPIQVLAHFADGSMRDVTRMAVYEPSNTHARVDADGVVTRNQFGETTILARYLHLQNPVRAAFVPSRSSFQWSAPPPASYIDRHIFAKLESLRVNPSPLAGDTVFLRRAFLDLLGLLPTAEEARRFVFDPNPDKRRLLIDDLLERPEFADHWALKWSDILRNEERVLDRKGVEAFHRWVRQSFLTRKPMDQFARELVSARGSTYANPPANFYRANRDPIARSEAVAQLFLGIRVQCAQCHSHPFDRWTQDDYYDWAKVFARVDYKILENRRRDENDKHEFKGEQIVFINAGKELMNPRTEGPAVPRLLGVSAKIPESQDELHELGLWLTSPDNPYFAPVQANRVWFHLMGRGLVEPIDDFRATNPASHPELLDALAKELVTSGYDLRQVIRVIMNSKTYQLSSQPNETNEEDEVNFSHAGVRRLSAEQMLDAQGQVLAVRADLSGYPAGTRAMQMAGSLPERRRKEKSSQTEAFLAVFGKPPRLIPSECERSSESTMGQAFQLMSGPVLHDLLVRKDNKLNQLLASDLSIPGQIQELFWSALSRNPTPVEEERCLELLQQSNDKRMAMEDLAWGLLNSKEFLFRH